MRKRDQAVLWVTLFLLVSAMWAIAEPPTSAETAKVIAREFGEKFKLLPQFSPMVLDLDRDGKPDLVVAVTIQNPLTGAAEHDYKVADPYSASFGFADTNLLLAYPTEAQPRFLAVIHDWLAEKPKAKFVLTNIPFEKLETGELKIKKKTFVTIQNVDITGVRGATYWDGKKYKWMPIGEDIPEFEKLETNKPQE